MLTDNQWWTSVAVGHGKTCLQIEDPPSAVAALSVGATVEAPIKLVNASPKLHGEWFSLFLICQYLETL